MIFEQFYLESLGHASYFVGSEETGEALVLDARRDVGVYFDAAKRCGMRVAYACDTHQHNDYISGICELPDRGDVKLLAAERAELDYPVKRLRDREKFEMGEVVFEVLHTPGHTPEHIALLVTDRSRGDVPTLLFSGGALLVGDVGRPDLLGKDQETARNIRLLCESLRGKILGLPDFVQVYPTHVSGSLCGATISSLLHSTIGYERRTNPVLRRLESKTPLDEACALDMAHLPAVPPYWARMRTRNQQGAPILPSGAGEVSPLSAELFDALSRDFIVLDCRSPEAYGVHIPGSLNVAAGAHFPTWAGTVLPEGAEVLLVVDDVSLLLETVLSLLRIGYPTPRGYLAGGMSAWRTANKRLEFMPLWTVQDLRQELLTNPDLFVLDVRQPGEWLAGHIPRATHITGAELPQRLEEVPRDRPVAVMCSSGYRSGVGASLLKRAGFRRVLNVLGGMSAWHRAGYETTHPAS